MNVLIDLFFLLNNNLKKERERKTKISIIKIKLISVIKNIKSVD